jgi:hypothetical protein
MELEVGIASLKLQWMLRLLEWDVSVSRKLRTSGSASSVFITVKLQVRAFTFSCSVGTGSGRMMTQYVVSGKYYLSVLERRVSWECVKFSNRFDRITFKNSSNTSVISHPQILFPQINLGSLLKHCIPGLWLVSLFHWACAMRTYRSYLKRAM